MKKFHITIIIVSVMLLFFVWNTYSVASAYPDDSFSNPVNYKIIYVKNGDSLWSIAANWVTPNDDIRNLIVNIKKINGLNNSVEIYPGQALRIPIKSAKDLAGNNENIVIRVMSGDTKLLTSKTQ